jgi:hypothetical protein
MPNLPDFTEREKIKHSKSYVRANIGPTAKNGHIRGRAVGTRHHQMKRSKAE